MTIAAAPAGYALQAYTDFPLAARFTFRDEEDAPLDVSAWDFTASAYSEARAVVETFDVDTTDAADGIVVLRLEDAKVNGLVRRQTWDLVATIDGTPTPILAGRLSRLVRGEASEDQEVVNPDVAVTVAASEVTVVQTGSIGPTGPASPPADEVARRDEPNDLTGRQKVVLTTAENGPEPALVVSVRSENADPESEPLDTVALAAFGIAGEGTTVAGVGALQFPPFGVQVGVVPPELLPSAPSGGLVVSDLMGGLQPVAVGTPADDAHAVPRSYLDSVAYGKFLGRFSFNSGDPDAIAVGADWEPLVVDGNPVSLDLGTPPTGWVRLTVCLAVKTDADGTLLVVAPTCPDGTPVTAAGVYVPAMATTDPVPQHVELLLEVAAVAGLNGNNEGQVNLGFACLAQGGTASVEVGLLPYTAAAYAA